MLTIVIPKSELFDDKTNTFIAINEQKLQLQHSLVSLAKWESKWHKPFISKEPKTMEQSIDYIRCMTMTQNVDPQVYMGVDKQILNKVNAYIDDPMTATWFNDKKNGRPPSREIVTAQLIYYWMISLEIPFECQKWHLNRLLTLIHVCDIKNGPAKKMSTKDIMSQNKALNRSRRSRMNTRG